MGTVNDREVAKGDSGMLDNNVPFDLDVQLRVCHLWQFIQQFLYNGAILSMYAVSQYKVH